MSVDPTPIGARCSEGPSGLAVTPLEDGAAGSPIAGPEPVDPYSKMGDPMSMSSVAKTALIALAVVVAYQKFGDRLPVVGK